jgi:hypothetical protein
VFSHLLLAWVQVWVQLKKEKWLPISRKRHQIGHLDFKAFQLLTEGLWLPFSNQFPKVLASIRLWLVPTCPSESGLKTNK